MRSSSERTPLQGSGQGAFVRNRLPYRRKLGDCRFCLLITILIVIGLLIIIIFNSVIIVNEEAPISNTSSLLLSSWPIPDQTQRNQTATKLTDKELQDALSFGLKQLEIKDNLDDSNSHLSIWSPSFRATRAMSTSLEAIKLSRIGYAINKATEKIARNRRDMRAEDISEKVPIDGGDWLPLEWCDYYSFTHQLKKYRTIDGSLNNLRHPFMWGVGMRPFRRALDPDYCDGISAPRCSKKGSHLHSARHVSHKLRRRFHREEYEFSVMLAVWGQFIDHDITATALTKGKNGESISCCESDDGERHPECFPVYIEEEDPYYGKYNDTCMEFVRSAPSPTCTLGPRNQMTQVSSFLDGSVVYGGTEKLARSLRTFTGGLLRMSISPDGRPLLPVSENITDGCNREEEAAKGRYCFESGDARANENLHLTSIHLLMARQHNLVAEKLASLNPHWDDETLYQESRRIVGAQIQHITYSEFLPTVLGSRTMKELELNPMKKGHYYRGYRDDVDPTISNSFATAAFRFAHSLIPGLMKASSDSSDPGYIELHKMLFNPFSLYTPKGLDDAIGGAMETHLQRGNNPELNGRLFEDSNPKNGTGKRCGLDLVSLNIQRGRDHGLPGYAKWRKHCGLSIPSSFDDLAEDMDAETIKILKQIYKSVEDVELYSGASAESPASGSLVGPTALCLIADQFKRLKVGDRFWYETPAQPQAFSIEQLDEIRKTTLASIICDTSDEVKEVRPQVMRGTRVGNKLTPCQTLPKLNIAAWKK